MFKKRSRPQTSTRSRQDDEENDLQNEDADPEDVDSSLLDDLIALRKFKRAKQGIDTDKLYVGDRKKRGKDRDDAGDTDKGGLSVVRSRHLDDEQDSDGEGARARKAVRSNNFTQQTNTLDVDKHMMNYIEQNLKTRRPITDAQQTTSRKDPKEELYKITTTASIKPASTAQTRNDDGSVTNSLTMLTAIPEVDLGIDTRLRNIEETEKAKRLVAEERLRPANRNQDEDHLIATRFQNPLAMLLSEHDVRNNVISGSEGNPPDADPRAARNWRDDTATDEKVLERFKKKMRK